MDKPSDNYIGRTVEAFLASSHKHVGGGFSCGRNLIEAFIVRFYPVLRHYRPEIVGRCLATAYDAPELVNSELHGFGMDMKAGDHPYERDSSLGSYRDDGCYLALQAHDFFAGVLR